MSTFKPDLIVPQEWYGFDFNRTLAEYYRYADDMRLARPLPLVTKVKEYLAMGRVCKILTAQVWVPAPRRFFSPTPEQIAWITEANGYHTRAAEARAAIEDWCLQYIGQKLEVTCERDRGCQEVWDDKARQVIPNTGRLLCQEGSRGVITMFEETGSWPPLPQTDSAKQKLVDKFQTLMQKSPNVMSWGNEKMSGFSTFSDEEIERAYWAMMQRRTGHAPELTLSPAAESLIAYTARFHKPPFCIFENEFTRAFDTKSSQSTQPDETSNPGPVAPQPGADARYEGSLSHA